MFERFTDPARVALTAAQEHARRLDHGYVGTEHLLLGLSEGDGVGARALAQAGFDRGRFEEAVLEEVGRGAAMAIPGLPFTPRAKQVLQAALGQSLRMGHDYVGTEHLVIGLLQDDSSLATKLVAEQGISAPAIEAAVIVLLTRIRTTTRQPSDEPAEPIPTRPPDTVAARCPRCDEPLAATLGTELIPSIGDVERPFTVAHCRACGHVLAVLPDD
jgi:ATP-dependent Clp protease ATP-binding subunit ClpC